MSACPACQRPIALLRATCLYCGAAVPVQDIVPATLSPATPSLSEPVESGRTLVVIWPQGQDAQALARVLDVDVYDAGQRLTRGGAQLWRSAPNADAYTDAERLRAAGIEVVALDERDVRETQTVTVVDGGAFDERRLRLQAGPQARQVERDDVLLVVQGPIARTLQADPQARASSKRRQAAPSTESGYRFHLHLRTPGARTLEFDPAAFEFEHGAEGQAPYLTLRRWISRLAPHAPVDDGFRLLTPALGPADPEAGGEARWAGLFGRREGQREHAARAWLDNLAQFRFHSAWRGLVERRRAGVPDAGQDPPAAAQRLS